MAITLQITDGTDTVDFNDGTSLYLGEAFQMNISDDPVSEIVISGWANGVDGDAKAVITKKFNRLIRKAITHYRERRIDRAVWLVWSPDDQTDTQYAKVMGGGEVEIVSHTVGGMGGGVFAPTVIREPAWRSVAPDGTAGPTVVSSATVYNKEDLDGTNEATIPATRTNDAPALLKITADVGSMAVLPDTMVIAMKRDISNTELNKLNMHWTPNNLTNLGGGSLVSNTDTPGDNQLQLTATGTMYWQITETNIDSYEGSYDVYVNMYSSASSNTIKFKTDFVEGEGIVISTSVVTNLIYLGNFSLPGTDFTPFVAVNTSGDLRLYLEYTEVTGGSTSYMRGIFLVPTDIPPTVVDFTVVANDEVVVDGVNEISYTTDSSGNQKLTGQVVTKGQFPRSIGGLANRLYFYWWGPKNGIYLTLYTPNNSAVVDVQVVDRFVGLRGNT